ncbi:hypothetical protein MASR2M70_17350 [Bacillota bacterium]
MPGLLLHFTLLLTEKKELLKKWWLYLLLYLPGLLMILNFSVNPVKGPLEDYFAYTIFGWVPISYNDFWDYFFYVYYIGYTVINLSVVLVTRRASRNKNRRTQLAVLAACYIAAFTLGTLSDIVLLLFDVLIPQHAPVYSLIPLLAIVFIVKKYGVMSEKSLMRRRLFRSDTVNDRVYLIMSIAFGIGSIVNIISQRVIYVETNIPYVSEFSIFLIGVSLCIMLVNRLKADGITKEIVMSVIYCLIIPYITLRYVEYGSTSVWAFAFLIVIICLVFSRQILLISVTVVTLMTQLLVWTISPLALVQINASDYIVRLTFVGIAAAFSFYVNSIYSSNLMENLSYTDKETVLSEIARDFIEAEDWNKDKVIYNLLKKCGCFVGSERAYVILFDADSNGFGFFCEWLEEGTVSQRKDFENLSLKDREKLMKQFEEDRIVKLTDAYLLPPLAKRFKRKLKEQNIRGMINLPIKEEDKIIGIIGFNSSKPIHEWNSDSIDFLEIMANLVSDMLLKIKMDERNSHLAYYDQITKLPNRTLFMDRLEQAIKHAKRTNTAIGVSFIDIDSFKVLNDSMGHVFGDEILLKIGQMLAESVRSYDTVARFGGDEFVIILNQLSGEKDAIKIMNEIMHEIRNPIRLGGQEFSVTISAGVALYPRDGIDSGTLIKNADTAMYDAKGRGKNRFSLCS